MKKKIRIQKHLLILVLLAFTSALLFSQESGTFRFPYFGPAIVYNDKNLNDISMTFYTGKKEKSRVIIDSAPIPTVLSEKNKDRFHRFILPVGINKTIKYHLDTDEDSLNGLSGKITIPTASGYRFAAFGDPESPNKSTFASVANRIASHSPAFTICLGSLTDDTGNKKQWMEFFAAGQKLFLNTVFLPIIGHSDTYSPAWRKIFDLPDLKYSFYEYNLPHATFLFLNSEMYFNADSIQYRWLTNRLEQAGDKFKIIAMHRGPLSSSESKGNPMTAAINATLGGVFLKYGVHLVLSSSDHLYERSMKEGTVFVVSGGASPIFSEITIPNEYRIKAATKVNHFVIADLTEKKIDLNVYTLNNERMDSFSIPRKFSKTVAGN